MSFGPEVSAAIQEILNSNLLSSDFFCSWILDKTSALSLVQSISIELNLILTDSIVKMHELCGYWLLSTDGLLSLYLCVKEGFLNILEENVVRFCM